MRRVSGRNLATRFALLGIAPLLLADASSASANASQIDETQATAVVRSYTDSLNQIVVSGEASGDTPKVDSLFARHMTETQEELARSITRIISVGVKYRSFETSVEISALTVDGARATAETTEHSRLYYDNNAQRSPDFHEFNASRAFTLVKSGSEWVIEKVTLHGKGLPPISEQTNPPMMTASPSTSIPPVSATMRSSVSRFSTQSDGGQLKTVRK